MIEIYQTQDTQVISDGNKLLQYYTKLYISKIFVTKSVYILDIMLNNDRVNR